jgi:hypothetical protein
MYLLFWGIASAATSRQIRGRVILGILMAVLFIGEIYGIIHPDLA